VGGGGGGGVFAKNTSLETKFQPRLAW
jgi:hypothetical protein